MASRRRVLTAMAAAGVTLAGCSQEPSGPPGFPEPSLAFASPAFQAGEAIPSRYACDGEGVSPPLTITGVPDSASTLAIVMDDPDANGYVHWLLWNVPAHTAEIPRDVPGTERVEALDGAPQGENSAGELGYFPCCPPPADGPHTYRFRLFAVDASLGVAPGATKQDLMAALERKAADRAVFTATYDR